MPDKEYNFDLKGKKKKPRGKKQTSEEDTWEVVQKRGRKWYPKKEQVIKKITGVERRWKAITVGTQPSNHLSLSWEQWNSRKTLKKMYKDRLDEQKKLKKDMDQAGP